jgi:hypothetical protein
LYFCGAHLFMASDFRATLCERCLENREPFEPTPDTQEWIHHKATDESWASWRAEQQASAEAQPVSNTPPEEQPGDASSSSDRSVIQRGVGSEG